MQLLFFFLTSSRNLGLLNLMTSDDLLHPGFPWINTTNPDSVSITEYREWYSHYSSMVGPNITDCSLEEEMNKVNLRYNFNELSLYKG